MSALNEMALIDAVDRLPETRGFGIITDGCSAGGVSFPSYGPVRVRPPVEADAGWIVIFCGPRTYVWENQAPSFWDKWGDTVFSCGSFAAGLVAAGLSAGTLTVVGGALLVNSGGLCALSFHKAVQPDWWQAFEAEGGTKYTAVLGLEKVMDLVDLFGGAKELLHWLRGMHRTKLAQLSKRLNANKVRSRKDLAQIIDEFDPSVRASLKNRKLHHLPKKQLRLIALNRITEAKARHLFDGISGALTVTGSINKAVQILLLPPESRQEGNGR